MVARKVRRAADLASFVAESVEDSGNVTSNTTATPPPDDGAEGVATARTWRIRRNEPGLTVPDALAVPEILAVPDALQDALTVPVALAVPVVVMLRLRDVDEVALPLGVCERDGDCVRDSLAVPVALGVALIVSV